LHISQESFGQILALKVGGRLMGGLVKNCRLMSHCAFCNAVLLSRVAPMRPVADIMKFLSTLTESPQLSRMTVPYAMFA